MCLGDNSVTLTGMSYISYKLKKDFDELFKSLEVHFRTEREHGFLFYAFGDKDFFIAEVGH